MGGIIKLHTYEIAYVQYEKFMCMCIHVCVCVCVCVCVHAHVYVCMCLRVHINACLCVCVCACVCVCVCEKTIKLLPGMKASGPPRNYFLTVWLSSRLLSTCLVNPACTLLHISDVSYPCVTFTPSLLLRVCPNSHRVKREISINQISGTK